LSAKASPAQDQHLVVIQNGGQPVGDGDDGGAAIAENKPFKWKMYSQSTVEQPETNHSLLEISIFNKHYFFLIILFEKWSEPFVSLPVSAQQKGSCLPPPEKLKPESGRAGSPRTSG